MKILVVLGENSFGGLVIEALAAMPAVEVYASRPRVGVSHCALNLASPATFHNALGMDACINCADPLSDARPNSFVDWCLRNGTLFVETTAHVATLESLYFDARRRDDQRSSRGALLLGAGLTPGLSNLLARELVEAENIAAGVDVFFDGHPPHGAALSRVEQLSELLRVNGARYVNGERIETPAIGPAIRLLDGGNYVRVGRAEALLLAWSGFARTTGTYARAPRWALKAARGLVRVLPGAKGTRALALLQSLARSRGAAGERPIWPLKITAIAGRHGDTRPSGSSVSLAVNDADWAAACAAALMAVEARRLKALPAPVVCADQVFRLGPLLESIRQLAGPRLSLTFEGAKIPSETKRDPVERRSLPTVVTTESELNEVQVA